MRLRVSSIRCSRPPADPAVIANLAELILELLDAHFDTAVLAAELSYEPQWAAHLDYLTALQRTAVETLARSIGGVPT
jgi:hypothetical protein